MAPLNLTNGLAWLLIAPLLVSASAHGQTIKLLQTDIENIQNIQSVLRAHAHGHPETLGGDDRYTLNHDPHEVIDAARRTLFALDGLVREDIPSQPEVDSLLRELLAVVRVSPNHRATATNLLATLHFRNGDERRALRFAADAALARPSSSHLASNCGYFLHATGHYRHARLVYEEARRLDPDNTAAHLGLVSLAPHLPDFEWATLPSLVHDWAQRERVPELHELAEELDFLLSDLPAAALSEATAEDADDTNDDNDNDNDDDITVEVVRELLETIFVSAVTTPQDNAPRRAKADGLRFRTGEHSRGAILSKTDN